jgi:hypothetical protein
MLPSVRVPVKVATAEPEAVPAIPYLVAQTAASLVSIAPIVVAPEEREVVTVLLPTVKVNRSSRPTDQSGLVSPTPAVTVEAAVKAVVVAYLSPTAVVAVVACAIN